MTLARPLARPLNQRVRRRLAAPSVVEWSPRALGSNLAGWWDAADAATVDDVAGAVSAWSDKSGNGHRVEQSVGSAQPVTGSVTMGGLNTLVFDFSAYLLPVSTFPDPDGADTIVAAVVQGFTGSGGINAGRIISGDNTNWTLVNSSNTLIYNQAAPSDNASMAAPSAPAVVLGYRRGATQQIRSNGVDGTATEGSTVAGSLSNFAIGGNASGSALLRASLGEIVISIGDASAETVTRLEAYLSAKWGV